MPSVGGTTGKVAYRDGFTPERSTTATSPGRGRTWASGSTRLGQSPTVTVEEILSRSRRGLRVPLSRFSSPALRGGERDPVVLGPRRAEDAPRSVEDLAGALAEQVGRLRASTLLAS